MYLNPTCHPKATIHHFKRSWKEHRGQATKQAFEFKIEILSSIFSDQNPTRNQLQKENWKSVLPRVNNTVLLHDHWFQGKIRKYLEETKTEIQHAKRVQHSRCGSERGGDRKRLKQPSFTVKELEKRTNEAQSQEKEGNDQKYIKLKLKR